MALSIVGTPQAAAAATVTIPTHAIGDLIVIWAFRDGSTTVPSKPTAGGTVPAWVDIDQSAGGGNSCSARTAQFVATANNHTSGTWTNATGMAAIVFRGQHASSPIGGHGLDTGAAANVVTAPAITLVDSSGASMILECYAHRGVTAWSAAPTGYTTQASVATEVLIGTKDVTTSDGAVTQNCTSSNAAWRSAAIEIRVAATAKPWLYRSHTRTLLGTTGARGLN